MSKYLRLALLALIGLSCVLLFLLVSASQNTVFFEKYYTVLLYINTFVMLVFMGMVGALLYQLYRNAKRKKYGVKILSKFALALGLTGVLPGILIFAVSVQFLHHSVDSWFDVRVERALDSGLTLGREVLENFQSNVLVKARKISAEIAETPPSGWLAVLDAAREREGVQEAVLITSSGNLLAVSGSSFGKLVPTVPSNRVLQAARTHGFWQTIDDNNPGLQRAQVVIPIPTADGSISLALRSQKDIFMLDAPSSGRESVFLELIDNVPPSLASNAETLMNGYRDYQEMVLARSGLRNIYSISLTLVLLLSMFGAIAISVIMANRISKPLMLLLEGIRRVGAGQYEQLPEVRTNDEVGELARSFNTMTGQLAQAREDLESRSEELGQAKEYLERILAKMSSGVIVLSSHSQLISANSAASRILGINLTECLGALLKDIMPAFASVVSEKLALCTEENSDISIQCEYQRPDKLQEKLNIFARATRLTLGEDKGYLLVFDDVTALAAAQRTEAWGEVARRLAHEIKNPLTPIQLAAERLEMKLKDKVQGRDQEILERATKTIVSQVTAMKQMVNDFRLYAKIGAPHHDRLDLTVFIEEVAHFYQAAGIRVQLALQEPMPAIEGDANQLRQVFHNLFSNAMEALPSKEQLVVSIRTSVIRNETSGEAEGVSLEVSDNGPGFTKQILEHAFEPYVTTKSSGTGLGLAMIKKIVDEHGASVTAVNLTDEKGEVRGAALFFVFRRLWTV